MPANLPPQYFEAEKVYREAKTPEEKIAAIEEMLAIMPHHKGTDHLRAELRTRIAKLTQMAGKKGGAARTSMLIDKEGAAQVVVTGLTGSGKSQLVGAVTKASPLVADYPFATQTPTPGMMIYENIQIQLIDTPPLAPQTMQWWIPHMLRRADALLIVISLNDDPLAQMEEILGHMRRMRIDIGVGGMEGEMVISQKKVFLVGNKIDVSDAQQNFIVLQQKYGAKLPVTAISAREKIALEELKLKVFQMLQLIRVYTKAPGKKPDFNDPIVLPEGNTMADAAAAVHKDFLANMKYARLWGSGKHDGIMVKRDHILHDGDVIELHI